MNKVTENKQFSLQGWDFAKGAIVAILSAVLTVVLQSLDAGNLDFDWLTIRTVAISAFIGYLLKNYSEPTKIVVTPEKGKEELTKQIITRSVR